MRENRRRGKMIRTVVLLLFLGVLLSGGKELRAAQDAVMAGRVGYFTVKIDGDRQTRMKIKVDYASTDESRPQKVKLSVVAGETVNNHKLTIRKVSETRQGSTQDVSKAYRDENGRYVTGTNSSGGLIYKTANYVVFTVQFSYEREAYTYASGRREVCNVDNRFNSTVYDEKDGWMNKGSETLSRKVYHAPRSETFSMQVNLSQTGIYSTNAPHFDNTVEGVYVVDLDHPGLMVSYNANGATGGAVTGNKKIVYNNSADLHNFSTFGLVKTGFRRKDGAEWNTKEDGTGKAFDQDKGYEATAYRDFADGTEFTSKSVTMYAQWIAGTPVPEYGTITYHGNGGVCTVDQQTEEIRSPSDYVQLKNINGGEVFHTDSGLMWDGFWYPSPVRSADDRYRFGEYYHLTESVTLYAGWIPKGYDVIYEPNGGEGRRVVQRCDRGGNYRFYDPYEDCGFTAPAGKRFIGWGISRAKPYYSAGGMFSDNLVGTDRTSMILYAIWGNDYQVVYLQDTGELWDPGNPTGSLDTGTDGITFPDGFISRINQTKVYVAGKERTLKFLGASQHEYGNIYTIFSGNGLSRKGYFFAGWAGTPGELESKLQQQGILNYDGNYVKVPSMKELKRVLSSCVYLEGGKQFQDLPMIYGHSVYSYEDGQKMHQVVPLFAQWIPVPGEYTVTFRPNGAYGTDYVMKCSYWQAYGFPGIPQEWRTQGIFSGWKRSGEGNGRIFEPGEVFQDMGTEVFDAQWTDQYTIRFDANGGNGNMEDMQLSINGRSELAENRFLLRGCEFDGWNTRVDGSGKSFRNKQLVRYSDFETEGDTVVLYAQWKGPYTVTYCLNNGSKIEREFQYEYGMSCSIREPEEVFPGCTMGRQRFLEWNTTADGTGKAWKPADVYGKMQPLTLYAVWIQTHTITLHAGKGIESVTGTGEYATGSTVTVSANVKPGYHWRHWTGTYSSGMMVFQFRMPAQDVDMTAEGEANQYTIRFDPNGGMELSHIEDIVTQYDVDVTLPDGAETYRKYTRNGENVTEQVQAGGLPQEGEAGISGNVAPQEQKEIRDMAGTVTPGEEDEERNISAEEKREPERPGEDLPEKPHREERAYPSVFLGWALSDGRGALTPQWTAGETVKNLTEEENGIVTLYAVWDDCPWIVAEDLYYTLEQAKSGYITEAELLRHATASDREDGSPILPGIHGNGTSFSIPDYQESDFTQFEHDGSCTENLTVVDSAGSTYKKQITVYVVDTTAAAVKQEGTTRFFSEKYLNAAYERGGLREESVWKRRPEYAAVLKSAFENFKNGTPEQSYRITHETVLEMKEFIRNYGAGKTKDSYGLLRFYQKFLQ